MPSGQVRDAMMKGYIQVYTGDGKGKTTAALGLSLRAAGAGLSVYFAQFIKQGAYSEITALKAFGGRVTVAQFGRGRFVTGVPAPEDVAAARDGLDKVRAAMASGNYDVVVMDEANGAVQAGLFPAAALLEIMDAKPDGVELVITGRGAHEAVMARADLVTEMKEVKHYYAMGVAARPGIEK
jgi:cob(I)alamin adenosyltransferase